mmetsp:Transcript_14388/g.28841  ORF Transcript_14388/g.28841 Transcript_14388/m.28841 type:complete len:111 (+) Transcript_14388:47-379(+)
MDMPIPNPCDSSHFLSPSDTRKYIDSKNPSLEMLKSYIPNPKLHSQEKRAVASAKAADKQRDFRASKIRGVLHCDTCSAPRCFYSTHCVGSRDEPNKQQLEQLLGRMENG